MLARRTTTDNAGDVLLTGYFQEEIDFGGGPLNSSAGSEDLYVAKLRTETSGVEPTVFGTLRLAVRPAHPVFFSRK